METNKPTCDVCSDTHRMESGDDSVMCTQCPLPCARCGNHAAYCKETPCDCECHGARPAGESEELCGDARWQMTCTREAGHQGGHAAHAHPGRIVGSWLADNESTAAETARKASAYDGLTARVAELEGVLIDLMRHGGAADAREGVESAVELEAAREALPAIHGPEPRECRHGSLRRKCEPCDVAEERDEALARVAELEDEASKPSTNKNLLGHIKKLEAVRDAATARAEAMADALREVEPILAMLAIQAGVETRSYSNTRWEGMSAMLGARASSVRTALYATPPTDLTQHPAYRAGIEAAAKVADTEPEPGDAGETAPPELLTLTRSNPNEVLLVTVRVTKRSIAARIRALLEAK